MKAKKIAILATDGFEDSELRKPYNELKKRGADLKIISVKEGSIRGWENGDWCDSTIKVDDTVENADSDEFDALILPGGVINPDMLRTNLKAVEFVRSFFDKKNRKLVAAICHGPIMLIEANEVEGRNLTSYHSIKTDLANAGATWIDSEVINDDLLITSRSPKDLDVFINEISDELDKMSDREVSAA